MNKPLKIRAIFSFLMPLIIAIVILSCDSLESDSVENQPAVELKKTPVMVAPKSSGIIDLNSLVVSSTDKFRFNISTPPKQGKLESINDYLLKYTPNAELTQGRDAFLLSIFGKDNMIIEEDTVIIIITPDSTAYPCGVYAFDDFVHDLYSDSVAVINVLGNDMACGVDPSLLQISIVEGDTSVGPAHGTVEVLAGGKIKYTPGPTFQMTDKFLYKIVKPEGIPTADDHIQTSIASVYITGVVPGCTALPLAVDDLFEIQFDSMVVVNDSSLNDTLYHYGPYYIPVTNNDFWCASDSLAIFVEEGAAGIIGPHYGAPGFMYTLPSNAYLGYEDRFKYKICTDNGCDIAEVTVKVK